MEQLELLRPSKMLDNLALIIIDHTYAAVLEIAGLDERQVPEGAAVEIGRPVDPADPDSPVLSVNSSARHCCIGISTPHGPTAAYRRLTSRSQKHAAGRTLHQASISVLPQTVSLSRVGAGRRTDYWTCAGVRPDVAGRGALGILEAVRKRLDMAMLCQERLCRMAKAGNYTGPKLDEIGEAWRTLERMSRALDLDAIMRTRREKRHRLHEIAAAAPAPPVDDGEADEPEILKRMKTLRVC